MSRTGQNGAQGGGTAALVLFSGGQDSTACLAWALDRYDRVETVGFDYGQRHAAELKAREAVRARIAETFPEWAKRLGRDETVDLKGYGAISETALTRETRIEIGESGLPTTFVPGRNIMFLTAAAALGWRRGVQTLVAGMCETDFSGYPDCRADTIAATAKALSLGLDREILIETPLMYLTKAQTWALAQELGGDELVRITVEDSHTCYLGERHPHPWGAGCGRCPACHLRAKGWQEWRAETASGAGA